MNIQNLRHWILAAAFLAGSDAACADIAEAEVAAPASDLSHARIGSITVRVHEIFDPANPGENKSIYRFANRLHVDTREDTLRAQLLFTEGDHFSPRVLQETERALRRLRYVRDPHVRVVSAHDGVVDVEVTATDVWTMSPGLSFGRKGGTNSTSFEFDDYNIFGTGKRLSIGSHSGVDRSSTDFLWSDANVLGSRWTTQLGYTDSDDGESMNVVVERPFYSFDTHWTAGLSLGSDTSVQHRYALGKRVDGYGRDARIADVHFGTSRGWDDGWVRRFTLGWRYDIARFADEPGSLPAAALPTDRNLSYPYAAVEFIQDDFETATNLDQIERTEDYAFGSRYLLELGAASPLYGADRNAAIVRAATSRGWRLHAGHSLFVAADFSGRLGGGARNSLLSARAKYYWRTGESSVFHLSLQGDVGQALDGDNELQLGGDNGLRGYPLRYQSGDARALLTAEQRFFTNWYPFHLFHVGGAVFADLGRTFGRTAIDAPNLGTLRDVGFGLRFSNSRSALANVLHLDVAFPLDGDSSMKNVQFLVESKRSF